MKCFSFQNLLSLKSTITVDFPFQVCGSIKLAEDNELSHERMPDTATGLNAVVSQAIKPEIERVLENSDRHQTHNDDRFNELKEGFNELKELIVGSRGASQSSERGSTDAGAGHSTSGLQNMAQVPLKKRAAQDRSPPLLYRCVSFFIREGGYNRKLNQTGSLPCLHGPPPLFSSYQASMDPAKGHQTITPFRHIPDATTMLEVFKREMALEEASGKKWRNYGRAAAQAWHARQRIFRLIKRTIDDSGDTAALEVLEKQISDNGTPLGRSTAPNWADINKNLGESQFEIDLAAQKRKRAAEFRDARNAKRAQAAEDALSQRPVLFHKDGATQLEEGEGRMEIDF